MISKHHKFARAIAILFASVAVFSLATYSGSGNQCRAQQTDAAATEAKTEEGSDDSDEWKKQSPEGANAEFLMPTKPRTMQRSFKPVSDKPQIVVKLNLSSIDAGQIVFVFSYHDLHELPESNKQISEILDGAVRGTVARVIGQLNSDENVSLREFPGRKITYEFTQNGQGLKSDSEIYLIGKRQYVLNAIYKDTNYDAELSKKFFDSFNPFNPEETVAMEESLDGQPLDDDNGFGVPGGQMPVELK